MTIRGRMVDHDQPNGGDEKANCILGGAMNKSHQAPENCSACLLLSKPPLQARLKHGGEGLGGGENIRGMEGVPEVFWRVMGTRKAASIFLGLCECNVHTWSCFCHSRGVAYQRVFLAVWHTPCSHDRCAFPGSVVGLIYSDNT